MSTLTLQIVQHNSPEYRKMVELRSKILREPLGLVYKEEDLQKEADQVHIMASVDEKVVGTLLLREKDQRTFWMRQVCVDDSMQGQGVGTRLVSFSEEYAIKRGFCRIELHARETAVKFYTDLAYEKVGDRFLEVGIPHFKMFKDWCA